MVGRRAGDPRVPRRAQPLELAGPHRADVGGAGPGSRGARPATRGALEVARPRALPRAGLHALVDARGRGGVGWAGAAGGGDVDGDGSGVSILWVEGSPSSHIGLYHALCNPIRHPGIKRDPSPFRLHPPQTLLAVLYASRFGILGVDEDVGLILMLKEARDIEMLGAKGGLSTRSRRKDKGIVLR